MFNNAGAAIRHLSKRKKKFYYVVYNVGRREQNGKVEKDASSILTFQTF